MRARPRARRHSQGGTRRWRSPGPARTASAVARSRVRRGLAEPGPSCADRRLEHDLTPFGCERPRGTREDADLGDVLGDLVGPRQVTDLAHVYVGGRGLRVGGADGAEQVKLRGDDPGAVPELA